MKQLFSLFFILSITTIANAAPNAKDLVAKANHLLWGNISTNHYIELVDHKHETIVKRKMVLYHKGNNLSFGRILTPSRDRDTTFLKKNKDMWTYSPKINKTIKIPSEILYDRVFNGSFNYVDLFNIENLINDYSHKILGLSRRMSEKHGNVYIIDLHPLSSNHANFKKLRLWIKEKPTPMILRQQYYDENLKVSRVLTFSEIGNFGGRDLPQVWKMIDLTKKGHFSVYKIINASYNDIEGDNLFDEKSLTKPPKTTWEQ